MCLIWISTGLHSCTSQDWSCVAVLWSVRLEQSCCDDLGGGAAYTNGYSHCHIRTCPRTDERSCKERGVKYCNKKLFFLQIIYLYWRFFSSISSIVLTTLDILNSRIYPLSSHNSYEVLQYAYQQLKHALGRYSQHIQYYLGHMLLSEQCLLSRAYRATKRYVNCQTAKVLVRNK